MNHRVSGATGEVVGHCANGEDIGRIDSGEGASDRGGCGDRDDGGSCVIAIRTESAAALHGHGQVRGERDAAVDAAAVELQIAASINIVVHVRGGGTERGVVFNDERTPADLNAIRRIRERYRRARERVGAKRESMSPSAPTL